MNYVRQVQEAGGIAVLLAPDPEPAELLPLLDGLLLTGGADIGDAPERDAFELAIAAAALEADVPVLGVCRGMQVMNVARGGTLIEHLPDTVGHEDHRADARARSATTTCGSPTARSPRRVAREGVHATKSHHHQGVDAIGDGLEVTGWATVDDLPEAIEDPSKRFALGVQWHPEADERSPMIAALVEAAR